jgi:hypothetical protein
MCKPFIPITVTALLLCGLYIPTLAGSPVSQNANPDTLGLPQHDGMGYLHVAEMIMGRVPGAVVSGSYPYYTIRIRGAMGPPLLVINDTPFYSANDDALFNDLLMSFSPVEIATIEVLKNIADTAIYGGNAGNGVIRIRLRGAEPLN